MPEDRIRAAWPTADDMALEALAARWNVYYRIGFDGLSYYADRADDAPRLTAGTIAGLESAVKANWARWLKLTAADVRDA